MAIRLAILANHYRSDWEWSDEKLTSAQDRLNNWRAAFKHDMAAPEVSLQIADALSQDLNTPGALAVIDDWAKRTLTSKNSDLDSNQIMKQTVDALLGVI